MNRETVIEDAILDDPGALGYPDALAIRHCRIGQPSGLVDMVLLPRVRPVDLVLVEAKAVSSSDATPKVGGMCVRDSGTVTDSGPPNKRGSATA